MKLTTVAHLTNSPRAFRRGQPPPSLRPSTSAGSWEGIGLSITYDDAECVDAWGTIAKLGEDVVRLDHVLVDANFLVFSASVQAAALRWAKRKKLVTVANGWRLTWIDQEDGSERYTTFATRAEAEAEADDESYEDADSRIEPTTRHLALPPLLNRLRDFFPRLDDASIERFGLAEIEALNMYAAEKGYDGVWYEDEFAPEALSAPRGVILPHSLPTWRVR